MRMEKLNWCYSVKRPGKCHQGTPEIFHTAAQPSRLGHHQELLLMLRGFSNTHVPLSTALHNITQAFKNNSIKIPALAFYAVLRPAQVTRYSWKGSQYHIAIVTRVNKDMTFKLVVAPVICFLKSKSLHLDGDWSGWTNVLWKRSLHISTAWLCHKRWQKSVACWYLIYLPQKTDLKATSPFSFVWQGKEGGCCY